MSICSRIQAFFIMMGLLIPSAVTAISVHNDYDSAGRLIRTQYDDDTEFRYIYDDVGNLISKSVGICSHNGDVNDSGGITAEDAQLSFFIVLSMISPTYEQECAADCNNNGRVTAADSQQIFNVVMGGPVCGAMPPTATPTFTPTPTITPTPSMTPTATETPTPTATPTYDPGGEFVATDPIVGPMRLAPATRPEGFTQGSPDAEPCRPGGPWEQQFAHILTRNIAVMETEVTRQMWSDLGTAQPDLPPDPTDTNYGAGMSNPVQNINWFQTVLFCNLLSITNGLTQCYYTDAGFAEAVTQSNYTTGPFFCNFDANGYRLPTEGEREYFCRARTTTVFSCDETNLIPFYCSDCDQGLLPVLELHAVYCANSNNSTAPVGSKLPNPWNLYDVHGNVNEWCWDWRAEYPEGPESDYTGGIGTSRVLRGGSFGVAGAVYSRSANRGSNSPGWNTRSNGFRLVRTISVK